MMETKILYTENTKPFVAQTNLRTFKVLRKKACRNGDVVFVNPDTDKEVFIPSHIKGRRGMKPYTMYDGKDGLPFTIVKSSHVHAAIGDVRPMIEELDSGQYVAFECFVPQGCEYYIGKNCCEVATKALFAAYELSNDELCALPDAWREVTRPIEESIDRQHVTCGWMVKRDGGFIHPSDYIESMRPDILGVVGFVNKGKAYVFNDKPIDLPRNVKGWNLWETTHCGVHIHVLTAIIDGLKAIMDKHPTGMNIYGETRIPNSEDCDMAHRQAFHYSMRLLNHNFGVTNVVAIPRDRSRLNVWNIGGEYGNCDQRRLSLIPMAVVPLQ